MAEGVQQGGTDPCIARNRSIPPPREGLKGAAGADALGEQEFHTSPTASPPLLCRFQLATPGAKIDQTPKIPKLGETRPAKDPNIRFATFPQFADPQGDAPTGAEPSGFPKGPARRMAGVLEGCKTSKAPAHMLNPVCCSAHFHPRRIETGELKQSLLQVEKQICGWPETCSCLSLASVSLQGWRKAGACGKNFWPRANI